MVTTNTIKFAVIAAAATMVAAQDWTGVIAPNTVKGDWKHVACFGEPQKDRRLRKGPTGYLNSEDKMTIEMCMTHCTTNGNDYK